MSAGIETARNWRPLPAKRAEPSVGHSGGVDSRNGEGPLLEVDARASAGATRHARLGQHPFESASLYRRQGQGSCCSEPLHGFRGLDLVLSFGAGFFVRSASFELGKRMRKPFSSSRQ